MILWAEWRTQSRYFDNAESFVFLHEVLVLLNREYVHALLTAPLSFFPSLNHAVLSLCIWEWNEHENALSTPIVLALYFLLFLNRAYTYSA